MKTATIVTIVLLFFLVGFGIYWYVKQNPAVIPGNSGQQTQEQEISGEYVCLPHADAEGPHTMECAFGLYTGDVYYALNLNVSDPAVMSTINTGDRIRVRGTITPVEGLSPDDTLLRYDIAGVFWANTIQKLPQNVSPAPLDETTSINGITFARLSDFGLAVQESQILVDAQVPPCASNFDYCLYYYDTQYDHTTFESAGVRIFRRTDLMDETACLNTKPSGYTSLTPDIQHGNTYAISSFSPLQNAATGHSSTGTLYRIFYDQNTCYEFETRIAVSSPDNYPAGTVEEFTQENRDAMEVRIEEVLDRVHFTDNREDIIFQRIQGA